MDARSLECTQGKPHLAFRALKLRHECVCGSLQRARVLPVAAKRAQHALQPEGAAVAVQRRVCGRDGEAALRGSGVVELDGRGVHREARRRVVRQALARRDGNGAHAAKRKGPLVAAQRALEAVRAQRSSVCRHQLEQDVGVGVARAG
jgi:hypothetical protein